MYMLRKTLCMLGNFACFFVVDIFQNKLFPEKFFQENLKVSNSLDTGPKVIKLFSMLNSAEHEPYPANKC